ncbi:MAG TPA: FlgD immunoglobulin-like domain containing protein [Candidatus Krumholzibacteria bacterium]|nr:FlgD immunoglobulin-like domain containing protein [Candidatus Krumholzibacteria bacterium]
MPRLRSILVIVTLACLGLPAPDARAAYGDITLVGFVELPLSTRITNVWGYSDPFTGKQYALVGDWFGGFWVVDTTDPANPFRVKHETAAAAFDLKVWGNYLYCCDGNNIGNDTRIFDITNPGNPLLVGAALPSCHTISISPRGLMFMEYVGVRMYDLTAGPEQPDSLYYIANQGHDSTPRGDRLYDFNGGSLNIWDISNPSLPTLIGSDDDPSVLYYHSGDESPDHNYLYVCDEYAVTPTPDIVIYDISNPATPTRVGEINDPTSRVHQLYVAGNLMFVGYYTAGFKVFDISDPANPVFADAYDTSPYQDETGPDIYNGAYNAYPYTPGGIVYVADHPTGLFLFSVEGHTGQPTAVRGPAPSAAQPLRSYPNPFNPATTVEYRTVTRQNVALHVYDVGGRLVRTLVDGTVPAGTHQVRWDGTDSLGRAVASGVYYCRLEAGSVRTTTRMVLLK